MKIILFRFSAVLFVLFCALAPVRAQTAPLAGFDLYVEKALRDWQVPGAAVAVVKDDRVVFAKGYGVKEIGKSEKIDEKTIFGVASNTKAFTAAALQILADEGKLNLDDKVIKYLPEFQLYDPWVTREITIRDLLTHRSGLPAYGGDILWWGGDYSRDEIIHRVRFVQPQTSFRSRYSYQNIPFITAGRIVEKVTGKSWDEFIKERFFKSLGMKDSTTSVKDLAGVTNKTTPHFFDAETGALIPIRWRNLDNGAPAAAINSNVLDMANWIRLNLNGGKFGEKQIVSEARINAMQTPQTILPFSNPKDQPRLKTNFAAYGLGWFLREYAGEKVVSHGGSTDGMLTQVAMLPDKKIGVVVLTNIHNRSFYTPIINRVFDAFLGLEPVDWSAYYLKLAKDAEKRELDEFRKKEADRAKDAKLILPLAAYAGTYENELYGKINFVKENGKLVVRMSHSPTYIGDLTHWQFHTFRVIWRDPVAEKTFLTFTIDQNGKPDSVKMAMASFIDDAEYEYRRTEK